MRVATWNVERPRPQHGARRQRLRAALTEVDADIWVLTETHDTLSPGVRFKAHSSGQPDRLHDPGERWVTIWLSVPFEPLATSDASRTAAVRAHLPKLGSVVIFGTVLPWLGSTWRGFPAAGGAAFRAALALQLSDWLRIRDANQDAALVLAGDLNQDFAERHYYGSRANRQALEHAFTSAGLRCLSAGQADPVPGHAPTHASIDHICVSPHLSLATAIRSWPPTSTPPRSLSDHFGLVADLSGA